MNDNSKRGYWGVHRISGRRSIHNHDSYCPFRKTDRNELSSSKLKEYAMPNNSLTGTDEVDNVLSKYARVSSPKEIRKNENVRRISLCLQRLSDDDSSDDGNFLCKSAPAIFSRSSFCRDAPELSYSSNYTLESTNSSLNQSSERRSTNQSPRGNVDNRNINMQATPRSGYWILDLKVLIFLIVVALAVIVAYYNLNMAKTEVSIIYDKLNFYNDINSVGSKYQINDNTILQVRTGIATIFERQDTGSFIFVYNSEKRDFNLANFNNFINEIAAAAARYLRNHTKTVKHVVVDPGNLRVHSDKELMDMYKEDVDETGVMLVKDLERMPSTVAMAFHYYCDEYSPLVKKSAILFTLNIARCTHATSEKYRENIEKCLAERWKNMRRDNIRPLLNRVVNVLIDVTSDF